MRFAIDRYSGKLVDASKARRMAFTCFCCGSRVVLRSGAVREKHFAHYPGEGSEECEMYHPGRPGSEEREFIDLGVEDTPESLGLSVALNGEAWNLYLRLPEVPTKELGYSSLQELSRARVDIFCDKSIIKSIPALDLHPGVGIARLEIPPTNQAYQCQPAGKWPRGVTLSRWDALAEGLLWEGNLFRLRKGEWTRLRARSLVEWGESLLLIAVSPCQLPSQVVAKARGKIKYRGLSWQLWDLRLPECLDDGVVAWLMRLGHKIRPPTWQIRFLSVPVEFTETASHYEVGAPLVIKLSGPTGGGMVKVSVTLGENRYEPLIPAPADCNVFGEINSAIPTDEGMIEVIDQGLANSLFEFVESRQDTCVLDSPRLQVRIGSGEWEPWCESANTKADRHGEVAISVGVEGARLDLIVWRRGGGRHILSRAAPSEVSKTLKDLLPEAERVEIDAGNLGHVRFLVGSETSDCSELKKKSRLNGWVNVMTSAAVLKDSRESFATVRGRGDLRKSISRVPSWLSSLVRARGEKIR